MSRRPETNDRHETGFTFIEVLVVLAILSLFTLIGVRMSTAVLHQQYENHFFTTLTQDVRYIQNVAMANKTATVQIYFNPTSYRVFSSHERFISFTRPLPSGWRIATSTFSIVSFTSKGSLKYSGTIYIDTPHNQFNVVFPLGKGSYYVTKR